MWVHIPLDNFNLAYLSALKHYQPPDFCWENLCIRLPIIQLTKEPTNSQALVQRDTATGDCLNNM